MMLSFSIPPLCVDFVRIFASKYQPNLMTSSVTGACDSPFPLPMWDYEYSEGVRQDLSWKHGSCRDRGFTIVHSVLYNVTNCKANASWIRENMVDFSLLPLDSSRVTFMA